MLRTKKNKSLKASSSQFDEGPVKLPTLAEEKQLYVEVQSIDKDTDTDLAKCGPGMTMEFDVIGLSPSLANAVRRALLVEVPSMAPETIMLQQNKSVMADEVLGHRIGLIPFKADARKFQFREKGSRADHPDYALVFELKVSVPKEKRHSDEWFTNTNIYSKHFKLARHPEYSKTSEESTVGPVFPNILLNILRPSQEIDLRVHVVKGIGKDHIKFSPVSVAFYRQLPVIRLLRSIVDEEAERLQDCFSSGVMAVDELEDGSKVARVVNPRLDSGSRNILREPNLARAVKLGVTKDHFMFSVESIGAANVTTLVKEACRILRDRCEYHFLSIGYQHQENISSH